MFELNTSKGRYIGKEDRVFKKTTKRLISTQRTTAVLGEIDLWRDDLQTEEDV